MKKIIALILILALCSVAMISCFNNGGNNGGNNEGGSENGGNNGDTGGEGEDNPFTPEFEGNDGGTDNIDPDGWTPVK